MKTLLKLTIPTLIIVTVLIGCKKDSQNNLNNQPEVSNPITLAQNYVPAGSTCPVPAGYTSCSSNCLFSDCCVVWDPKKETGGCSCFFGVARCKTQAIETPQKTSEIRSITFHAKNFENFLMYLSRNRIDITLIERSYQENIVVYNPEKKADVIVAPVSYDKFVSDYEEFISGLNIAEHDLMVNYLNLIQ